MFSQPATAANFQISKLDFAKFTGLTSTGESGKCFNEIRVNGEITEGDGERFKKAYAELRNINASLGCQNTRSEHISVSLNSKGGSVSEAIRTGRLIREYELSTKIYKNDICASACVLMFGAGINKISFGKIQIHRPYFADLDANLTRKQIQDMRFKIIDEMKKYANEMDFSAALIDEMIAIPPENVRTLSKEEVARFRMIGDDPTSDEKRVAERAAFYNITSAEYRKRDIEASDKCLNNTNPSIECYHSMMLNISVSEASKRINKIEAKCPQNSPSLNQCVKNILVYGR